MEDHCHVEPIQKLTTADEQKNVELALLAVSGMAAQIVPTGFATASSPYTGLQMPMLITLRELRK